MNKQKIMCFLSFFLFLFFFFFCCFFPLHISFESWSLSSHRRGACITSRKILFRDVGSPIPDQQDGVNDKTKIWESHFSPGIFRYTSPSIYLDNCSNLMLSFGPCRPCRFWGSEKWVISLKVIGTSRLKVISSTLHTARLTPCWAAPLAVAQPEDQRKSLEAFPLCLSGEGTQLVTMRFRVWSLASLSGLKIRCCCELWCRSQTWLGSWVAVTMAQASNCSSDSTPSLGTSICCRCRPKKTKKQKTIIMPFAATWIEVI